MPRIVAAGFCLVLSLAALSTAATAADVAVGNQQTATPGGAAPGGSAALVRASNVKRTFTTEAEAVTGCGTDPVVWINRNTEVFHLKESRWYGKTKDGAFACRGEAELSGFHAAKTVK